MSPNTCYLCLGSVQGRGGVPHTFISFFPRSSARAMRSVKHDFQVTDKNATTYSNTINPRCFQAQPDIAAFEFTP